MKEETVAGRKRLCRVGAAVTNEEFRRWAIAGNAWSLPVDVILVEVRQTYQYVTRSLVLTLSQVTIGGVNGPICHGAGISHKTLSDYVRRIEYVDCNGQIQVVDDPLQIKAAAGAFGLLGVLTHITFELDAMTYAVIVSYHNSLSCDGWLTSIQQPVKEDVGLGVPPLDKNDIPLALRSDWFHSPNANELLASAKETFERRAANDYYSE